MAKCLNCEHWNLRGSSPDMRKAGWAPCSLSKFRYEKWQGIIERDCSTFEQAADETVKKREEYLRISK